MLTVQAWFEQHKGHRLTMGRDTRGCGKGCGRGNCYNNNGWFGNYQRGQQKQQSELKFYPHTAGRQQTVTYDKVKDHIIQYIQKTYQQGFNIAKTLRDLNKIDYNTIQPARTVSQETDESLQLDEQDSFDILYKAKIDDWVQRKNQYKDNLKRSYAVIFGYCSKVMQNRLETHVNYETKIRDDPVELLKTIKIIMHDPERTRYPYASLTKALSRIINMKQQEKEGLITPS